MSWDPDFFYSAPSHQHEQFAQRLDESLSPRDPSVLLQVVRELGLPPDSLVVDVGCGEGTHAFRLVTHFGFRVVGVDPVQRHLDAARAARRDEPERVASRVSFERGSATHIGLRTGSVDLVWCRDALSDLADPAAAYAEFARVLRPGGYVVNHLVVATPALAADEADSLFGALGLQPRAADPRVLDEAVSDSGLTVVDTIDLAGEWGEWSQETSGRAGQALLHLARLLREPERYRREFGDAAYDEMLAHCRWHVCRMSGKLAGRLEVLQRP